MEKKISYVYADLQFYKIAFDDETVLFFDEAIDARNYVLNEKRDAEIAKKQTHDEKILRDQTLVVSECITVLLCVIGAAFAPDPIVKAISVITGAMTITLSQKIIDELNFPLVRKECELGEYIEKLTLFSNEFNRSASYALQNEKNQGDQGVSKNYSATYPNSLSQDKPKTLQKINHKKNTKY